ncbi:MULTISPECIES: IS110 family transposase [Rhizobium]|uniref:IS110 family transposase n=4 Tax=Rhizobium tropici TaxID=398 RepID=A0A6P1C8Z8_RHITR|nr:MULTISPECIES: IS110 family transposase [Rhizobium]AGB73824.1 putative IS110 family transposase [Rhizobium tropici CIAT 899]AGB75658.1 putative IS5 family transposase, IS1031 group [Rhizobium tropici CIAT 899]MBB5595770.1 transposase [Rhizobium tropici]NEV12866.1 IS110 family transposase [Rhizobium tropici]TGE97357.1 IS110 family transposase [Rhizobium sp. SEMIA 4088]
MADTIARTLGIDISKDRLDVHLLPDGIDKQFLNDAKGLRTLIRWLSPYAPTRIVFEATGAYHRRLERMLATANLPGVKVNPQRLRAFAKACGRLAKTDRIDASVMARFGAVMAPDIRPIRSQALDLLAELLTARRALVKDRSALLHRQKQLTIPLLQRQAEQRLRQVEAQIEAVDAESRRLIAAEPQLQHRFDILTSIPGIGATCAMALIADMPELGTLANKQAASLAGLAPIVRQSGQWRGKSFIQGGRTQLRRALYMPALVAIRFNPDLKSKYQQLTATGKAAKAAITAIMRKLIVLANALIREDRFWTPQQA